MSPCRPLKTSRLKVVRASVKPVSSVVFSPYWIENSVGRSSNRLQGGSTITQQLAKNLFFGTRKTPVRKLRELVVTRWLEEDLSKARILALYLADDRNHRAAIDFLRGDA